VVLGDYWLCGPPCEKERSNNGKETRKFVTSVRRLLDLSTRCDPGIMPLLPSGSMYDVRRKDDDDKDHAHA
jgi:hypothetical protein